MHIRDGSFHLFCEIYADETCTRARAHACIYAYYTYVSTTPASHERHGTESGVRSLNFDPETSTARPFCAWPSTTGRRACMYVHRWKRTNGRNAEIAVEKRPLSSSSGVLGDSNDFLPLFPTSLFKTVVPIIQRIIDGIRNSLKKL